MAASTVPSTLAVSDSDNTVQEIKPNECQPGQPSLGVVTTTQIPIPSSHDAPKAGRQLRGFAWFIMVVALILSTFLYALDNTVLANVRPSIIDTLGRIDLLPYVSITYPLGEVGSSPLWGKLNNLFNNKILFLIALAVFEIGSAVIGSARSMEAVIVGRAIAGFGGSGIYMGTMNIVSAMTTPTERQLYLNHIGIAWSLGTILGPIIGGAFADSSATWRWAFYINIVVAAFGGPTCVFLVPPVLPPAANTRTVWERIKQVDYVGEILFLGGVLVLVMILGSGGAVYSWTSGQMIGLYAAAPVIWILFYVQQRFEIFTVDRIFPLQLAGDWQTVSLFFWAALAIANNVVTIYSLPLLFQFAFNDSALRAAVWTLPFIAALLASGGPLGPIFPKFPVYWIWFAAAGSLMLIGGGLLTTINYSTSRGAIVGYTVIQGLGCGPVVQLPFTVGQAKVARSEAGAVTGFLTCAQMGGLVLSLGIATTVFLNLTTNDIAAILPDQPLSLIQAAINGDSSSFFEQLDPDIRQQIVEIIAHNIGKVFYLNVAGSGFGLVTALLMKRERLQLRVEE
ncbi:putative efflux pump antibiotic resistance protein [Durotheca rogersii]|uniref:putative efflux pump antibiotic resistance protein n=1 Tax=Durotheca rogersii TaxID=419775 RepID=UPI00221FC378|nr:putative efflux pump antibiotic resistance protein [Durotheca rogersii]KAI5867646.1 putative efflux pump antibiotic resistance protein [Durotheca rogersii]